MKEKQPVIDWTYVIIGLFGVGILILIMVGTPASAFNGTINLAMGGKYQEKGLTVICGKPDFSIYDLVQKVLPLNLGATEFSTVDKILIK